MVATIYVLSEGFDGAYYTGGGAAGYYAAALTPGRWFGAGAVALGLPGAVDAAVFARLLANRHPTRERPLIKKPKRRVEPLAQSKNTEESPRKVRADHRPGFDVTFSAPKSFSVLMSVADEELCRELEAAFDRAVNATLSWAERNIRLTRRGQGGRQAETAKLVLAIFPHNDNRNGEPDFHRHVVVLNACLADRWLTINSRELHHWVRTLGPIFRCQLGAEVARLGYELERSRDAQGKPQSWAEVVGVPKPLCDQLSSRRDEIERELAGDANSIGGGSAKARSRANKVTRKKKETSLSEGEKRMLWRAIAAQHRFGVAETRLLAQRDGAAVPDAETEYRRAWGAALAKLSETESIFPERRLIQFVFEELQASGTDIDKIFRWIARDLAAAEDVLPLSAEDGAMQYSTRANWEVEERLLATVADLRARPGVVTSTVKVERYLQSRSDLSQEQAEAVRKLAAERSAIRTFGGVAGSGKSRTLDALRAVLEAQGYTVIGGAISGAAKEELRNAAGIPSRTVASLLYHLDKAERTTPVDRGNEEPPLAASSLRREQSRRQPPVVELNDKTVVKIDEAGMLDSKTFARLARHVERCGATLIAVGDDRQIQPIQAGGPFHHLCKQHVTASLTENRRQRNRRDAQAVADIRDGKAERAVESYARRGRITIGQNRLDTIHKLVDQWVRQGGAAAPAEHFVFTQKRSEARLVNRLCQAERLAHLPYASKQGIAVDQERLYVGDRVLFHKPYRVAGIENGFRGTVLTLNPIRRTITVRLDEKSTQGKSVAAVVSVPVDRLGPNGVTPGYAATSHKLQGGSVEHSYMLLGSMTDQQMGYVQATRGKQSTRIFIDKHHADDELRGLVASLKRSNVKRLAHDLVRPKPDATLRLQIEP